MRSLLQMASSTNSGMRLADTVQETLEIFKLEKLVKVQNCTSSKLRIKLLLFESFAAEL